MPNRQYLLDRLNRRLDAGGYTVDQEWSTGDYAREGLLDIPRGVASGVIGFTQSVGSIADQGFEALGFEGFDDEILDSSYRPESLKTKTVFGSVVGAGTQFALSYALTRGIAGKTGAAAGVAGLVSKAGKVGRTLAGSKIAASAAYGGIADFLAFQGDEGRVSDMLLNLGGSGDNIVTRYLATDKADSWLEARFKNVVEGAILGVAFDSIVGALGAAVKRGEITADEAVTRAKELFQDMSPEQQAELEKGVSSAIKGSGPDEDELDEFVPDEVDEIVDEPIDEPTVKADEPTDWSTWFAPREAEGTPGRPVATEARTFFHFSREDRSATGLQRKHAGSGFAGQEKKHFVKTEDGLTDPDTAAVHLYSEGTAPEREIVTDYVHQIDLSKAKLLEVDSDEYDAIQAAARKNPGENYVKTRNRLVREAGYDGVYAKAYGYAQLFRDVAPEEITRVAKLDEAQRARLTTIRGGKAGLDVLRAAPAPQAKPAPAAKVVDESTPAAQPNQPAAKPDPSEQAKKIRDEVKAARAAGLDADEALQEGMNLHINYSHLENPADVTAVLKAIEPEAQKNIDKAIQASRSNEETLARAAELSEDPEQLLADLESLGLKLTDVESQLVAGRMLRNTVAGQVADLAMKVEAIDRGEIAGDAVAAWDELQKAIMAAERVDTLVGLVQKPSARAVQSGNIDVGEASAQGVLDLLRGVESPEAQAAAAVVEAAAKEGNEELAAVFKAVAAEENPVAAAKAAGTEPAPTAAPPAAPASGAPAGAPPSQATPTPAAPQTPSTGQGGPNTQAAPAAPAAGSQPSANVPQTGAAAAPAAPAPAPAIPAPNARVLTPGQRRIVQAVTQAHRTGQTARVVRQLKAAHKAGMLDVFLEYYKASILSGMPTFMINVVSGGVNTALQAVARTLGSAVSGNMQETKRSFQFMVNLVGALGDMVKYTFVSGAGDGPRGFKTAGRTFITEKPTLTNATAIEGLQAIKAETFGLSNKSIAGRGVNALGKIIRLPMAANMSAEEMISQLNYLAYIRTKAHEVVDRMVWDNPAVPAHMKEAAALQLHDQYVRDAFDSIGGAKTRKPWWQSQTDPVFLHQDAAKYSQSITYTQDLIAGIGQSITQFKQNHRWADLIVPFVKAPTNLIRQAMRMTPGAHLIDRRFAAKHLTRSTEEVMRARGELLIGSALWGYGIYLASSGQVTGGGPMNREERAALTATGWRPYSLVRTKADGSKEYIEYRRFDPIAVILGISADFAEAGAYLNDAEKDTFAKAAVFALANNITSKTYLQGLSEAMRALSRPDMSGGQYLQNRLAALVPNFLARASAANDPYMREARTVLDAMRRRIPGLAQELPPRRNVLGEPVTPTPGYIPFSNTTTPGMANKLSRMASPAAFSRSVNDTVKDELAALHYGFSMPAVRLNGIDLTTIKTSKGQEAYDRYVELSGQVKIGGLTLSQRLSKLINSAAYQRLEMPADRSDAANPRVRQIQAVMAAYRNRAKAELLKETPEIRETILELRRASVQGGSKNPILAKLQQR